MMAHSCTLQESCRVFVQVLQPTAHWINARGFGKGRDHHAKSPANVTRHQLPSPGLGQYHVHIIKLCSPGL